MHILCQRCVELFQTRDLYEVLGVTKDATKRDLKQAYYKLSLVYHPDRVSSEDKELATKKFQVLSLVYILLSDDGRRTEYNEMGQIDEEFTTAEDQDWDEYWRLLFPKITIQNIEEFSENYKGSDEELEDLKKVYLSKEGDMEAVMNNMLCSCYDDEPRFIKLIMGLIKDELVPYFPAFSKENSKKKAATVQKARAEAIEAEEEARRLKLGKSEDSLTTAIALRQATRAKQAEDFLSKLETKYCGSAVKDKKRRRNQKI